MGCVKGKPAKSEANARKSIESIPEVPKKPDYNKPAKQERTETTTTTSSSNSGARGAAVPNEPLDPDLPADEGNHAEVHNSSYNSVRINHLSSSQKQQGKLSPAFGLLHSSTVPGLIASDLTEARKTLPLLLSQRNVEAYDPNQSIDLSLEDTAGAVLARTRTKLSTSSKALYALIRASRSSAFNLLYRGQVIPESDRPIGDFRILKSGVVNCMWR